MTTPSTPSQQQSDDLDQYFKEQEAATLEFTHFNDWLKTSPHQNCVAIFVDEVGVEIQCSVCTKSWKVYKTKASYNVGNYRHHACQPVSEVNCF